MTVVQYFLTDAGQQLAQNIIAIIALFFAVRGVRNWNQERRDLRRADLAEQALALAYRAREVISAVRSPFGFAGEGSSRKAEAHESEDLKRARDRAFTPIERLNHHVAMFDEIQSLHYLIRAAFGQAQAAPMLKFIEARAQIHAAASTNFQLADGFKGPQDRLLDKELSATIYRGWGKPDEIANALDEAVETLEQEFRPYVEARFTRRPELLARIAQRFIRALPF